VSGSLPSHFTAEEIEAPERNNLHSTGTVHSELGTNPYFLVVTLPADPAPLDPKTTHGPTCQCTPYVGQLENYFQASLGTSNNIIYI
jgi:hypothetical protein